MQRLRPRRPGPAGGCAHAVPFRVPQSAAKWIVVAVSDDGRTSNPEVTMLLTDERSLKPSGLAFRSCPQGIGLRDLHVDDLEDLLLNGHSGQQLSVRRALRVNCCRSRSGRGTRRKQRGARSSPHGNAAVARAALGDVKVAPAGASPAVLAGTTAAATHVPRPWARAVSCSATVRNKPDRRSPDPSSPGIPKSRRRRRSTSGHN